MDTLDRQASSCYVLCVPATVRHLHIYLFLKLVATTRLMCSHLAATIANHGLEDIDFDWDAFTFAILTKSTLVAIEMLQV